MPKYARRVIFEFMNTETTKPVLVAISKVMADTGSVQKRGKNEFHNYSYATASDIAAVLQKTMATHGLIIIQHEKERQFCHNESILTVTYEFTLAHVSGDVWGEKIVQTGMCSAKNTKGGIDDKAINKCHTAARKYFVLGLFFIPTGDYADSDAGPDIAPPDNEPVPPRTFDERPGLLEKLGRLTPNDETKDMLRAYLRVVPNKAGICALAPDGEIGDIETSLLKYLIANWSTVIVKVDEWNNNPLGVGGDVSAAPEPSTWRNAKPPYFPKDHPDMQGKTIGELFDTEKTNGWAKGVLLNYAAKPYTAKDGTVRQPKPSDIEFEKACLAWRTA